MVKKYLFILLAFLFLSANPLFASDIDLFVTQASPNVLIILDNSNSMDEDFYGNAVGSFSPESKTVVGKKALRSIMEELKDKLRMGLMTYRVSAVEARYLHNSPEFIFYDPKSYCPNPAPECVTYAQTGDGGAKSVCEAACRADNSLFDATYLDEIITNYGFGSEQRNRYSRLIFPHTQRRVNPTDTSRYMYFKHAYPFYSDSNQGTAFCYGTGYSPGEGVYPVGPWDNYTCHTIKTGTNDDYLSGYSGSSFGVSLVPTDTDYALGYGDFGQRLSWYYVGRTWFAEGSPGNGYLHVPVDDLVDKQGDTNTYKNIYDKLDPKDDLKDDTEYMSCSKGDKNTCSYVLNAGLTPTAGTLQEATKYFKGEGGYTSPIDLWCRKNFIIYVTDGLPSVNESGTPNTATSLMPTVLGKLDTLRDIVTRIKGKDYHFDVKTYVLGVGLSDEAKLELNKMAVHGGTDVSGQAYYANNPTELRDVLRQIFSSVVESAYSFTSPTVPSVRMIEKDILYISSFTPNEDSFWPGSLMGYQLNADGTLPVDVSGFPLQAPIWVASIPDSGSRVIKTAVGGGLKDFTSVNLARGDLGVGTNAERDALISYIRSLPLGDIFHSNSVIVGPPSQFFRDSGFSGTGGFYERKKDRTKVIIVGANDGMLHAFDATTGVTTGVEKWAFIPNSVLQNLKSMQTTHTYYVDSTPKVADVWFYSDPADTTKSWDEWRTVLVCGLRKGGQHYFALDITDTLNPQYLWQFPHPGDPKISDYSDFLNNKIGQSWSEPAIGRVKVKTGNEVYERWVAFIGGGFDKNNKVGGAFFVVDIKTGEIIKEFYKLSGMNYSLAAPPSAVDTLGSGYVNKIYIGDLGGQMWVFDVSSNDIAEWSGKRLFEAQGKKHRIYYQPAVALDKSRTPWVFFGTGDREDPTDKNSDERFYAVKDDGKGNYPREEEKKDLKNVTTYSDKTFKTPEDPPYKGWYIELAKAEKVLAKPAMFYNLLYFTTYTHISTEACETTGKATLYQVEYLSGGGALVLDDYLQGTPSKRSEEKGIGEGIPSAPVISVSLGGKASVTIATTSKKIVSEETISPTTNKEILYWREVIP